MNNSRLVFLGIALTALIINIDATAINLALASIGQTFHATLSTLQWIITIYFLFGISFQIFTGRVADVFGRKKYI